jgi:hypothetical protein
MSQQLIRTARLILTIAGISLLALPICAAIEAPILQNRLDRLYFGIGTEAAVYPGCSFHVLCQTDTLARGTIEQSLPGISYSYPLTPPVALPSLEDCHAIVDPARIDSTSPIIIAAPHILNTLTQTDHLPRDHAGAIDDPATAPMTSAGNRLILTDTIPFIDAPASLQFGMIDAFLDYRDHTTALPQSNAASSPAPYLAVLLPNLSRPVNREALLTTSLYYRFSAERLSLVFPGDRVLPLNCLLLDNAECPRPYPYDPPRGRRLLSQIDPPVRDLRLGVADPSLQRTGLLFVDVLARDRVSASLLMHDQATEADCRIAWISAPLGDLLTPLQHILRHLTAMNSPHSTHRDVLETVDRYLTAAADAPDSAGRLAYARLAAQRLSADLGVFALFRPRLFFHAQPDIMNITFDRSGRPLFTNLQRLLLPAVEHTYQGELQP